MMTASFFCSGCAAMISGTTDTIHVRSEVPDTIFYANSREIGRGYSAITSIRKKDLSSTTLRAEKEGCHPKSAPIETTFDVVTLLGVFIDYGIVSILIIDGLATGAIIKAAQVDYILTPDCSGGGASRAGVLESGYALAPEELDVKTPKHVGIP
jgi:hypothetical protein